MIKKNYKRIIKGFLFICLTFLICINIKNVDAEQEKNKCEEEIYFGETVEDDTAGTITVSSGTGMFDILVYIDGEEKNYTINSNEKIGIYYNSSMEHTIYINLIYTGDNECYKRDDLDDIKSKIKANAGEKLKKDEVAGNIYYRNYYFSTNEKAEISTLKNEFYDTICKDYRDGNWTNLGYSSDDAEILRNFDANSKKSFNSTCYKEEVSYSLSEEEVTKKIKIAANYYLSKNKTNESTTESTIKENAEETFKLDENSNEINLTGEKGLKCDILNLGTNSGKYEYVNKHVYEATKSTEKKYTTSLKTYVCTKTCTEKIKVEYGPPVATIAGMCFEYKVKVTSEVTCTSNPGDVTPPNKDDYEYCEPTPNCISTSGLTESTDAGPNEEFDSCISTCDNGKYTQKCINKCYNKVYSKNTNKLLNYTDKVEATKLSSSCNAILNMTDYHKIKQEYGTIEKFAEVLSAKISKATDVECYGKYEYENGSITWKKGTGGHWTKYARYYFYNAEKALQTIYHDATVFNGISDPAAGKRKPNEFRYYSPTNKGFKTWTHYKNHESDAKMNGAAKCGDNCSYIKCAGENNLNPSDVKGDYDKDLEIYNKFITECSKETTCSTDTATFTIKVNNKTKKTNIEKELKNTIKNNNGNVTLTVDENTQENIILSSDNCYLQNGLKKNKYMTEWSVPGSWINNKTGDVSQDNKKDSKSIWHQKKDYYCTSLDSEDVNVHWWYYGMSKSMGKDDNQSKKDISECYKKMTDDDLKNSVDEWNIKATTRKFGYFNWNIDVSCFYALYNETDKPDPDESKIPCNEDPVCEGDECNPSQQYRIRTVDNADLFPSTDGTATTDATATGRTPGFNWTENAQNLKNINYIIDPTKLIENIQSNKDSVYAEEAEYSFILSPTDLKAIRDNTASNKNYLDYKGSYEVKNGVSVYRSNLFRGNGSVLKNSTLGTLGCNNQKANSSQCDNY